MDRNTENSLVEGMEHLGLLATQIRQKGFSLSAIEVDIILEELRDLYKMALRVSVEEHAATVIVPKEAAAKKVAEEAATKKAAEEAAAKKAAEEAATKKAAEEAAAKKVAEEAAAKKVAEEAAAKKAAEEAAAKKAAEEAAAKKAAEEAATKKATEEQYLFAPEKPHKETPSIVEPMIDRLEGNPNNELFSDISEAPAPMSKGGAKAKEQGTSVLDYLKKGNPTDQPVTRTLADTFQQGNSEEGGIHIRKVDDLRTVININDKFSFMSELFHNNMRAYNEFIMRLNGCTDRQQGLDCVSEVAAQYQWDENSLTVKNFFKIFDRKF